MTDAVRTKVAIGVAGTPNAAIQTAMTSFNTALATAIATATDAARYPVGSDSQSTTKGAPTDPSGLVTTGNICCGFDGTNFYFSTIISYYKYV